ncbi:MAG: c-type cytochrome domain-containing protein [Akkermansiaceae bacterium]
MPKLLPSISILVASAALLHADDGKKITYQDHIRTIFENSCFNCHNPDKAKGGLDLTTYTNTMTGGSSGEIVAPGSSADSRLYKSVAHLEDPKMPPKGDKLSDPELNLIAKWINGGVLETSGSAARKPKKPTFDLTIKNTGPDRPEGPPPMPEHHLLEPPVISARASAQADIASSPWAPLVAITGQKQVILYNTDSHQLVGVLPFPEGFPEHLSFSRNGTLLLASGGRGGKSGRVVVWDVKTGKRVSEIGNEFDTVFAADITSDNTLVALGGTSRRIKIYHTSDGSELISIKKHTDWITALSFSPDGILLATGDRNGGLFVWEAATGNPFYTLKAHTGAITSITWRSDSNIVASSSEDGSVRLWAMSNGKQVKNWAAHSGGVTDLDFMRDGRLVSVGRDKHAKIWDQAGAVKKDITGFADIPLAAAFSHDGKKFITGDWLGNVNVWDSSTGKTITKLSAAPPAIATRLGEIAKRTSDQQTRVAAASKKHSDLAALVPPIESRGTEALKQINALSAERKRAETELQNSRQAIADATAAREQADVANKSEFEEQLKQANAALGAATGKITQLDKQLADANNALSTRQAELKTAKENASKAKAEFDTANGKLAAIKKQQQHWQAAQINAQRLSKTEELAKLQAELDFLQEDQAAADQLIATAQAKVAATKKAVTDAPEVIAAKQQSLTEAKAKVPTIKNKLRLTAVIVENKRIAVENLNKIEPKTNEVKAVLAVATKEHQDAIARQKAQQSEKNAAQLAITKATSELKKAQVDQANAPKAVAAAHAELAAANAKKAALQEPLLAQQENVTKAKQEVDKLWKNYQAALPK